MHDIDRALVNLVKSPGDYFGNRRDGDVLAEILPYQPRRGPPFEVSSGGEAVPDGVDIALISVAAALGTVAPMLVTLLVWL